MYPIAHIAAPLLGLAIYDKIRKGCGKARVPKFWYLIIALAGVLPDLLNGGHTYAFERVGFAHSIFLPLAFLLIYVILKYVRKEYSVYALLFFFGSAIHLVLDAITAQLIIFYPFSSYELTSLILFPVNIVNALGVMWVDKWAAAVWYGFGLAFFVLYLIVDKTNIIEKITKKIKS